MKETVVAGVVIALLIGIAIGTQSTLNTSLGRVISPINSGLVINLLGGGLAALIIVARGLHEGGSWANLFSVAVLKPAVLAGFLGIIIMVGAAFAFQRAGIAAGTATVFLGQMLVGVIVDAMGWSGGKPLMIDLRRIAGLAILVIAVYLLTPRQ